MKKTQIETRDLTPALWPELEKLFGKSGACGGCWCMYWRVEKGEKWEDLKGPPAKKRMKALVAKGQSQGVLAFVDGEPVGWCAYGRRTEFARLDRSKTLACDDAERVWSLPCFFIHRNHRGQGVATALLKHAMGSIRAHKGAIAEGYPVKPSAPGKSIPAAFAWTGTLSLFEACGFKPVGDQKTGKIRVRLPPGAEEPSVVNEQAGMTNGPGDAEIAALMAPPAPALTMTPALQKAIKMLQLSRAELIEIVCDELLDDEQ